MLAEAETEDWEDGVSLSLSNVCFADLQSCHQNTLRYLFGLEKRIASQGHRKCSLVTETEMIATKTSLKQILETGRKCTKHICKSPRFSSLCVSIVQNVPRG